MKIIFLIVLICLNFSFFGLFCNEKHFDNLNNEISSNISFNFVSNFKENDLVFFKKNTSIDKSSEDYKKMIGSYALGFTGVGITAFLLVGSAVTIIMALFIYIVDSLVHNSTIVATIVAYVALGLFTGGILIGVPLIIAGFYAASFYKKKATIYNNVSRYKIDGVTNNPEIAFSIPL